MRLSAFEEGKRLSLVLAYTRARGGIFFQALGIALAKGKWEAVAVCQFEAQASETLFTYAGPLCSQHCREVTCPDQCSHPRRMRCEEQSPVWLR